MLAFFLHAKEKWKQKVRDNPMLNLIIPRAGLGSGRAWQSPMKKSQARPRPEAHERWRF